MIKFGHLKLFYGIVYASGSGYNGQLGNGRTDRHDEGTPISIDTANMDGKRETELTCQSVSQRVIQVSASQYHSLFLCEDGSVYASGDGQSGVLGDGRIDNHAEGTPIPIDRDNMDGKEVIQVSAGSVHSLFLCEDGSVYASGDGQSGVLGDGRTDNHNEGTPIPIDRANMDGKEVIQVSAGSVHSLFLCEDGSVYASGNGEYGRLGDGRTDRHEEGTPISINKPTDVYEERVIQVSAGQNHSLFLLRDGSVYASGNGEHGQLGDGICYLTYIFYDYPQLRDFTYHGSGYKEYGELGYGPTEYAEEGTPILIDIVYKRVIQVSAGWSHSLFLCEDGSVYASGYGKNGQLGNGINHSIVTPLQIDTANINKKRIIQVSAGCTHSLFLT